MIHIIQLFLKKMKRQSRYTLAKLCLAYFLLIALSSLTVSLVEPEGTALTDFWEAVWWSIVTSTTVGYGDVSPVSGAGKLAAVIMPMFLGIGIAAAFLTYIASIFIERKDKKMHGDIEYTGRGHILIVGHTSETTGIIEQILSDEQRKQGDIVLLANLDRHPLPDEAQVHFVKGKPDTKQALKKANASQADQIIIHTGSDEETLFAQVNVLSLVKEECDVTIRCLSSDSLATFSSVPGRFEIIMQMTAEMLCQAMQDKVHIPLQVLLRNDEAEEIYLLVTPKMDTDWVWWPLHADLKARYDYLTFAMQAPGESVKVNPPSRTKVPGGSRVWLIAKKRPQGIDWQAVSKRTDS
jgi:voltage-gated potassium channel